ncbi:MAG: hypothetical protein N2643_05510 [Endomicrobia bacterium]|nr:hypothetical protein [Endomicrobiia bacterium]
MRKDKIVISGIGVITPGGVDYIKFWKDLLNKVSYISDIKRFDTSKYKSKLAGEVLNFQPEKIVRNNSILRLPLISQFAYCAAFLAISGAKLEILKDNSLRVGVFFGTSNGAIGSTEKIFNNIVSFGPETADPLLFAETVFNAPASIISIKFGIKGPVVVCANGLASGSIAITQAYKYLKWNIIDYAIVGAAEEHTEVVHEAFSNLKVLSPLFSNDDCNNKEFSMPFDKRRNGMILSEGGSFLILEREETAKRRKVNIFGEIIAGSCISDAYKLADNSPCGKGVELSINKLLKEANLSLYDIDYIIAFAPSMPDWDIMEARGIKKVFGEHIYYIPITSIKGLTGEAKSVSTFLNIIAAVLSIKEKKLFLCLTIFYLIKSVVLIILLTDL